MSRNRFLLLALCLVALNLSFVTSALAQDAAQGIGETLSNTNISFVNPLTGEGFTVTLFRVLYAVGGLVLLFLGWRFFRVALSVGGFVVGSSIGASIALQAGLGQFAVLLSSLLVGVVGALLALFAFWIGVALAGGYVGWLLAEAITSWLSIQFANPNTLLLVLIVGAVLGAALAIALAFELTVVLTAYLGAVMVAAGFGLIGSGTGFVWVVALFILGLVVQVVIARRTGGSAFQRRAVP